jgi:hypothetical protein
MVWCGAVYMQVVSITSFNEWGEGTQIEPARMNAAISADVASSLSKDEYIDYGEELGERGYLVKTAEWADKFNIHQQQMMKQQKDVSVREIHKLEL